MRRNIAFDERGIRIEPLPDFGDVQAAAKRLEGVARRTPLLAGTPLDELTGGRILLKLESLQVTGSFKIRGAYNRLVQLDEAERRQGVVAFSSGNHAQGVAAAAKMLGIRATIVMPSDAPRAKLENTRALGAEVVLYDRVRESREQIAAKLAADQGATLVPAFDDPHVIAGQGTTGLELMQQAGELGLKPDQVLIPCSGGGLVSGSALAIRALSPTAAVYGVEPEAFDDTRRSLAAGRLLDESAGGPVDLRRLAIVTAREADLRAQSRIAGRNPHGQRRRGRNRDGLCIPDSAARHRAGWRRGARRRTRRQAAARATAPRRSSSAAAMSTSSDSSRR